MMRNMVTVLPGMLALGILCSVQGVQALSKRQVCQSVAELPLAGVEPGPQVEHP